MTDRPSLVPDSIDRAIRYLITTSNSLHDVLFGGKTEKLWFTWSGKFLASYIKANNPAGYKPMFQAFIDRYESHLFSPIFYENEEGVTVVNDALYKDTAIFPMPGPPARHRLKGSWSPHDAYCRGLVIYFNDEPRFRAVSIPFGEMYQAAVKRYTEESAQDDARARAFPGKLLLGLFATCLHVLDPSHPRYADLRQNVRVLGEFVDQVSPAEGSSDALGGISQIMASVMKQMGMKGDINADQLRGVLSSAVSGDAVQGMGRVVTQVFEKIGESNPQNLGDVLGKVGEALQTKEIQDLGRQVQDQSGSLFTAAAPSAVETSTAGGAASSSGSTVEVAATFNPEDQE